MRFDLDTLLTATLEEDGAFEDRSGLVSLRPEQTATAGIIAKQAGTISGIELVERAVAIVADRIGSLNVTVHCNDGTGVEPGTLVATLSGNGRALLAVERTALNLLCAMSGVASLTETFVALVAGTNVLIKDTRKTLPLWRAQQRAAVRHGGGHNHRYSLSDMIMLKENHLACIGGIAAAGVAMAAVTTPGELWEIEVRNQAELAEACSLQVPRIMLDNFSLTDLAAGVQYARQHSPASILEASGNVNLDRVRAIAETGVDEISIGALTHSAPVLDLSLLIEWT
jgi:nicotinate-nucleotide pyrophosphorylase (carboxylating)